MTDVPRTVPLHNCCENDGCPVCAPPRWSVAVAPPHEVEAGASPVLTVTLYGNDQGEIREAFDSMRKIMGVAE